MKKLIFSIVLTAACSLMLFAARSPQNDGNSVSVTGTAVTLADPGTVSVSFQLHVGEGVTAKNRSMVIRPVLPKGEQSTDLPVIIIRGPRAKVNAENKAMTAAEVNPEGRYVTANGTVLEYFALVPWKDWMAGSQLMFNGINVGSGNPTEVTIGLVAENLLAGQQGQESLASTISYGEPNAAASVAPPVSSSATITATSSTSTSTGSTATITTPTQTYAPTQPVVRGATVGDDLAARFEFIEPVANYNIAINATSIDPVFDYNMPLVFGTGATVKDDEVGRFVEMTRVGALYIAFDRGSNIAGRELGQNNKMLIELISSIRVLTGDPTTRIAQVVVVGFSSPEGNDEKETLAAERAGAVRDFLTANSRIDPAVISTYNGSVDWATLRALVAESNMQDKYRVLEIIDNVPVWGGTQGRGRMDTLKELEGGRAFNYIRDNFFPQLRQTGAYVKVYYENL
jgi:hypothetical protein